MLLLAAMIGCIVIAIRPVPRGTAIQKQATPVGANGSANKIITETNDLVVEQNL
jgi:NADH-quinone oxidoreductase subunit J